MKVKLLETSKYVYEAAVEIWERKKTVLAKRPIKYIFMVVSAAAVNLKLCRIARKGKMFNQQNQRHINEHLQIPIHAKITKVCFNLKILSSTGKG